MLAKILIAAKLNQTIVFVVSPVFGESTFSEFGLSGVTASFFSNAARASLIAAAIASTSFCFVISKPRLTALTAASTFEKSVYSSLFKASAFAIASSTFE